MTVFRVDNRLVHGQIIEAWLPYTGAEHVFVAQDALAQDILQQEIMSLAMPQRVQMHFVSVEKVLSLLAAYPKSFVLFENLHDLQRCLQGATDSMAFAYLNIGNLHDASHADSHNGALAKKHIAPHIFVTDAEWKILERLNQQYDLDFRSIPSEKNRGLYELNL